MPQAPGLQSLRTQQQTCSLRLVPRAQPWPVLSPGKRSGVRCCPDVLPRWPQGTGRKGEPGHRLKHLLPPPASQESYRASWTCGDITGPHLFKLTMEAFCPALLRASFHSSSSPRIMYLEKGETPMLIRRDYFRENRKVTSCPRRHKSCTSMGTAERWTGVRPGSR